MGGFEDRTGIGARLVTVIVLSTLACSFVLSLLGGLIGFFVQGIAPEVGAVGFIGSVGLVFAVMLLPITLPGALMGWVAAWHLAWRLRWSEFGRACIAGAGAGMGATATLAVWGPLAGTTQLSASVGAVVLLICVATSLTGIAAAAFVYHPTWKRPEGQSIE